MENNKIYQMSFKKVYGLLLNKVLRKSRTEDELKFVISWLTGYSKLEIENFLVNDIAYGDFFLQAPSLNPKRLELKGQVCNVKLEEIKEPLMKEIRYLDKLVDDLAKGKKLTKMLDF